MKHAPLLVLVGMVAPSLASAAPRGIGGFGGLAGSADRGTAVEADVGATAACLPNEIAFDGDCLDALNIASFLGLSEDEIVDYRRCIDDDGDDIDDCVVLQIDEGGFPETYYDYVVEAAPCSSTFSWSRSPQMCLGAYQTVSRARHEVDTWEYGNLLEETDVITHQVVGSRRGRAIWVDDSRAVVEYEVSTGASSSEGLEYVMTMRAETLDGELIEEDTIYGGIIAHSSGSGRTPEERCAGMKGTKVARGEAIGDSFTALCDLLNPASGFSALGVSVTRNLDYCDSMGTSLKSVQKWAAEREYQACLDNPGAFFPEAFMLGVNLGEMGLFTIIPKSTIGGECDDLDGQVVTVQYTRTNDAEETETCTVVAELECEEADGDCACTGTPLDEPSCE